MFYQKVDKLKRKIMQTFIIFWCGVFICWLGLVGCLLKKRMKEINDP